MNKRGYGSQHLKFLLISIVMIVLLDKFAFDGTRPYIEEARQEAAANVTAPVVYKEAEVEAEQPEKVVMARVPPALKAEKEHLEYKETYGPWDLPAWQKHAVPVVLDPDKPKVVIVIDDLGVSRGNSKKVLELPGPLTLAFLPYPRGLKSLVKTGRENGHEIMVHMPMEPQNADLDMGGIYLSTKQSPGEFEEMLDKGLSAFGGFVGLNNHMGSKLTQNKEAMQTVMGVLHRRGLLFLDSKTIGSSVAGKTAAEYQVPYAIRDVFLDHDPSLEGVKASLAKLERVALEHGRAIGIGHPKASTIEALEEWLPTLEEKGLQLVPVSAVVKTPASLSTVSSQSSAPPHQ